MINEQMLILPQVDNMNVATAEQNRFSPSDIIAALRQFTKNEWDEVLAFIETEIPTIWGKIPAIQQHKALSFQQTEAHREAIEAVENMAGIIPIEDPQLGRWLAESPELSTYGEGVSASQQKNITAQQATPE